MKKQIPQTAKNADCHLLIGIVLGSDDAQVFADLRLDILEVAFALPVTLEVQRAAGAQSQQARIEVDALLLNVAALLEGTTGVPAAQQVAADAAEGFEALRGCGLAAWNGEVVELVLALVLAVVGEAADVVDDQFRFIG